MRIVCDIKDDDQLRGRLLRETDLSLEKAISISRTSEITPNQMKVLNDEIEVHRVKAVKPQK